MEKKKIEDAGQLMFSIWAIEKAVSAEGATTLVHAAHHLHVSRVLDEETKPLKPLHDNLYYFSQLVFRQVCEEIAHDALALTKTNDELVSQLIDGHARFHDFETEFMLPLVKEWRVRQTLHF